MRKIRPVKARWLRRERPTAILRLIAVFTGYMVFGACLILLIVIFSEGI